LTRRTAYFGADQKRTKQIKRTAFSIKTDGISGSLGRNPCGFHFLCAFFRRARALCSTEYSDENPITPSTSKLGSPDFMFFVSKTNFFTLLCKQAVKAVAKAGKI